jgi:hypothetical protein
MPFEQGFGLHNDDNLAQQLAERFAFFGEHLALGLLEAPMRRMPIEQGAVNAVFLQHIFQFLAQGLVDLPCGPRQ